MGTALEPRGKWRGGTRGMAASVMAQRDKLWTRAKWNHENSNWKHQESNRHLRKFRALKIIGY